jgi:hypothetical protein
MQERVVIHCHICDDTRTRHGFFPLYSDRIEVNYSKPTLLVVLPYLSMSLDCRSQIVDCIVSLLQITSPSSPSVCAAPDGGSTSHTASRRDSMSASMSPSALQSAQVPLPLVEVYAVVCPLQCVRRRPSRSPRPPARSRPQAT